MPDWFIGLGAVQQAFLATCFTWFVTALGAAVVFFFKGVNQKLLDAMMGFAAGVMIAASIWSLLLPAIEMAESNGVTGWIPAAIGFLLGGAVLALIDKVLPHLHIGFPREEAEGVATRWRRSEFHVRYTQINFPGEPLGPLPPDRSRDPDIAAGVGAGLPAGAASGPLRG